MSYFKLLMPIWKLLFLMATNVANMWERVNEKSVYKYELVVFNIGELDLVVFIDVENEQLVFNDIENSSSESSRFYILWILFGIDSVSSWLNRLDWHNFYQLGREMRSVWSWNEKSVYKYELVVFNIGENDQVEFTDVENDQLIFIYWLLISRPNWYILILKFWKSFCS